MSDITAAIDEVAVTPLIHNAEAALGTSSRSGSGRLGSFDVSWSAKASFSGGAVDLIAPGTIRLADITMSYSLGVSFSLALSSILPVLCLPSVCVNIPCVGEVCTPPICIDWPSITIPTSFSDSLLFTADFRLETYLAGADWKVDLVVEGLPSLELTPAAGRLLSTIGDAAAAALAPVPFIGPFLGGAILLIKNTIATAGARGLLGLILTPFVSGIRYTVITQPRIQEVLPAAGPSDPAVRIQLDAVSAAIVSSDEDEFVLSVDISPA